jgi:hypothetical protein
VPDDYISPPSLPPGASGEDILRTMLPLVVESATKAAEGQTASAAAIGALETQLSEVKTELQGIRSEMQSARNSKAAEEKVREENGKWLRSLLKPELIYYTVVLILTAMGLRATIPAPVHLPEVDMPAPRSIPGEVP